MAAHPTLRIEYIRPYDTPWLCLHAERGVGLRWPLSRTADVAKMLADVGADAFVEDEFGVVSSPQVGTSDEGAFSYRLDEIDHRFAEDEVDQGKTRVVGSGEWSIGRGLVLTNEQWARIAKDVADAPQKLKAQGAAVQSLAQSMTRSRHAPRKVAPRRGSVRRYL